MKEKKINYDSDVFVSGFNYGYSLVSKYPEVLSDKETYLSGILHGIEQYEIEIIKNLKQGIKDKENNMYEIVNLLASGFTYKEIAEKLNKPVEKIRKDAYEIYQHLKANEIENSEKNK